MDAEVRAMLEDGFLRFDRERYTVEYRRESDTRPDGYSAALWQEMADLGWMSLIDDAESRSDVLQGLVPLFVAAGRGGWREPLLPVLAEAAAALWAAPPSTLRKALLDGIVCGTERIVLAHREARSDAECYAAPKHALATLQGDLHVLDGEKSLVTAAVTSTSLLVTARLADGSGHGLFHVRADASGLEFSDFRGIDGRGAAALIMAATPATLLATGDAPLDAAARWAAILGAAEAAGAISAVNALTVEHLRTRRQFGRVLSEFQALQHRVAEMFMHDREVRALVDAAAMAADGSSADLDRLLLVLRARVSTAAREVAREGIQLHGAMGLTQEARMGDYYRRILMLDSLLGGADRALQALTASTDH